MSITQADFNEACSALQLRWQIVSSVTEWEDARLMDDFGSTFLRITRRLNLDLGESAEHDDDVVEEEDIEHDDEEILKDITKHVERQVVVVYDIVYAISYQVPVLYLTFKTIGSNVFQACGPPSPEEIYDFLVPMEFKSQMESVGMVGALSVTDHPVTNSPAYFVHPCRTTEAMGATIGRETAIPPLSYLMVWFGLVGQTVGLNVPVELAREMQNDRDDGRPGA